MTDIFYPDCFARSPNGYWFLEARSPHNGTIPYRDGTPATDADFGFRYRSHQRDFRYRLLRLPEAGVLPESIRERDRCVVWERWQPESEDSPHELIVSDEGWCVLRTHGFKPMVIVISPTGDELARVRVVWSEVGPTSGADATGEWSVKYMSPSTAGDFWADHSWPYFLRHQGGQFFVWRAVGGEKLIVNLAAGRLLTGGEPEAHGFDDAMRQAERDGVLQFLSDWSRRVGDVDRRLLQQRDDDPPEPTLAEIDFRGGIARLVAAVHLVAVHRVVEALPYLRCWEATDWPSYSTSSVGAKGLSVHYQSLRPILHHAIRSIGGTPQGFPACQFIEDGRKRFVVPPPPVDRQRRIENLQTFLSGRDVLLLAGSPDHVRKESHETEKRLYRWSEDWEYDFTDGTAWFTWRITWMEEGRDVRMQSVERIDAYAVTTDRRLPEILRPF